MKLIQRAAAGRGGGAWTGWGGYCCSRTDREAIIWGMEGGGRGSICLLPLLIGTSASEAATDAEAQRERWRAMVELMYPARLLRGDSPQVSLTTVVFKY